MKIYCLAMQKGGVGKTTTALNLGYGLWHKGKKVLFIDLDAQTNLTYSTGADSSNKGSYELLKGENINNCITPIKDGLDIVVANWNLISIDTEEEVSYTRLKEALQDLKGYDVVIIDTPPTTSKLQFNGLLASNGVIIPVMANRFSYNGLDQIAQTITTFKKNNNRKLKIEGIVVTNFEARSNINKQTKEHLIMKANKLGIAYLGTIRKGIAVEEASALKQDLYEYAPKSKPCLDYIDLANTLYTEI